MTASFIDCAIFALLFIACADLYSENGAFVAGHIDKRATKHAETKEKLLKFVEKGKCHILVVSMKNFFGIRNGLR